MDLELACGDNNKADTEKTTAAVNMIDETTFEHDVAKSSVPGSEEKCQQETVDEKEIEIKNRIENCRKIIESLKQELSEEKAKLKEDSKNTSDYEIKDFSTFYSSQNNKGNREYTTHLARDNMSEPDANYLLCSATVDSKLHCDETLMEYEKQLQKYQNTLNMAQAEKKNAIRKQMLTKAYKLKLLEVENQCNIELLRVKQSLQCLEPLQMIVRKWKTNEKDINYNLNNYELIPRYPEINPVSISDPNFFTDDEKSEIIATNDNV